MGLSRFAGIVLPLLVAVGACSSSSSTDASSGATPGDDGGGSSGGPGGQDAGNDAPAPPASGCKLQAVTGATAVTPTFKFYDPPSSVPPTMTGGKPSGKYVVTAATFYLPTNVKSVAHPDKSTGTVTGWSNFDGTSYHLFLHASATIDTSLGPQQQKNDVDSQGSFSVDKEKLLVDYACDPAAPDPLPDYTFTDDGSGKSTLVIRSTTTFGDGYLYLEATRQ